MASIVVDGLMRSLGEQRGYALRLVDDLSDADMVAQPVAGVVMNHPAWILGHLSAYPPTLAAMLRGEAPADPLRHPFGRDSKPEPGIGVYGSKQNVVDEFVHVHDDLSSALAGTQGVRFGDAMPIERWRSRFPTVGDACFYLVTTHIATHLGQLSAWRRAGRRASV